MKNVPEADYFVIPTPEAFELFANDKFISSVLLNEQGFGPCFECIKIDQAGLYLQMEVRYKYLLVSKKILSVVELQIPYSSVFYIVGDRHKSALGFRKPE